MTGCECPLDLPCACHLQAGSPTYGSHVPESCATANVSDTPDEWAARHGYRRTNPGDEPAHYVLDREPCLCCQGAPCAC